MTKEINLEEVNYLFYKKNEKIDFDNLNDNELIQSICDDLEQIVKELGFEWDDVNDFVNELKANMFYTLRSGFHLLSNKK
jgi:hypothetical protein